MARLIGIFTSKSLVIIFTIVFLLTSVLNLNNITDVQAATPVCKDTSLGAVAVVNDNPPSITISWPRPSLTITNYEVYRKGYNDNSWGPVYKQVNGEDTSFIDTNVVVGIGYEYYISAINNEVTNTSYVYSGIKLPATEYRGKVILLVDDTYIPFISNEINTLVTDMTGDGWQVIQHNILRASKPPEIKALIKTDYDADPTNVKSVFILGHIAVPKSGPISPDGHGKRSFPADCYYGDMVGNWPNAYGVFTLDSIPNEIQLEVGRVDAFNFDMAYHNSDLEADYIKTYLKKDHKYRMKINPAPNTAFIDDYFYDSNGYGYNGSNLWRNLGPILDNGYNSVTEGDWTKELSKTAYSWGCITGFGSPASVNRGMVTTNTVIASDYKVNFIMSFGSYFCEWDVANDILRAPLFAKDYGLESMWVGRPNWFIHSMGMGTTFGYGMKTSINNGINNIYSPMGNLPSGIHMALMGDPTLRLFIIDPPTNQKLENISDTTNKLTWDASKDSVLGYYIYRADNANSQYKRITNQIVSTTSYTDNVAPSADARYMIRAVRLEITGSGSYYNLSQGAFAPTPENITINPTAIPFSVPTAASITSIELINAPTPTPTPIPAIVSISKDIEYCWAKDTILRLNSQGIIRGYEDNTIRPDKNITREEFVTLVIRALGIDINNTKEVGFRDNDSISDWAKPYISTAVENNIISGYEDNTFRGTANIKRCEIAILALRALGYNNLADTETNFSDNSVIPQWAKKYVVKASEIGLMQGYNNGDDLIFIAEDFATRAECFDVIDRMMRAISKG